MIEGWCSHSSSFHLAPMEQDKTKPFGFPKQEKLCSKKAIEATFAAGKSLYCYPYKVFYLESAASENEPFAQAMFVVPKKRFKKAVHRNAIRRKMREVYRLNKTLLANWCVPNEVRVNLIFMYVGETPVSFSSHEKAMQSIFSSLIKKLADEILS